MSEILRKCSYWLLGGYVAVNLIFFSIPFYYALPAIFFAADIYWLQPFVQSLLISSLAALAAWFPGLGLAIVILNVRQNRLRSALASMIGAFSSFPTILVAFTGVLYSLHEIPGTLPTVFLLSALLIPYSANYYLRDLQKLPAGIWDSCHALGLDPLATMQLTIRITAPLTITVLLSSFSRIIGETMIVYLITLKQPAIQGLTANIARIMQQNPESSFKELAVFAVLIILVVLITRILAFFLKQKFYRAVYNVG